MLDGVSISGLLDRVDWLKKENVSLKEISRSSRTDVECLAKAAIFEWPEADNSTMLLQQIMHINALPDASDGTGYEQTPQFIYRYSFKLANTTSPDAFWATLLLKAAEANRFVDVITKCQRQNDLDLGFLRNIIVHPAPNVEVRVTERVFVAESCQTVMYRERGGDGLLSYPLMLVITSARRSWATSAIPR
jgi:hypothetical protein